MSTDDSRPPSATVSTLRGKRPSTSLDGQPSAPLMRAPAVDQLLSRPATSPIGPLLEQLNRERKAAADAATVPAAAPPAPPAVSLPPAGGARRAWLEQRAAATASAARELVAGLPPRSVASRDAMVGLIPIIATLGGAMLNAWLVQKPMESFVGAGFIFFWPLAYLGALALVGLETATGVVLTAIWRASPARGPHVSRPWLDKDRNWLEYGRSWWDWARECLTTAGRWLAWLSKVASVSLLVLVFVGIEAGLVYIRERLRIDGLISEATLRLSLSLDEDARALAAKFLEHPPTIDLWSLLPQMALGGALPLVLILIASRVERFAEDVRVICIHAKSGRLERTALRIREQLAIRDDSSARLAASRVKRQAQREAAQRARQAAREGRRQWITSLVDRLIRKGAP